VPTFGLSDHVTAVFPVLVTVAVNWLVCDGCSEALPGDTLTATGSRLMVVAADLVLSALLTMITDTEVAVEIRAGAVYKPEPFRLPTLYGFRDQLTPVLGVLVTVAVN